MLGYRLYFLPFKLGELRLKYHTTTDLYPFLSLVFLSLLLINLAGAILGYEMSRIRRIREWGTSTQWNLLGFVLGMTLLGCSIIMGLFYKEVDLLYEVTTVYGESLFLFGILLLTIVVGRTLWSKISEYKCMHATVKKTRQLLADKPKTCRILLFEQLEQFSLNY